MLWRQLRFWSLPADQRPRGGRMSEMSLVAVGDSTLTMSDVLNQIPGGLNPVDSANMFRRIVGDWVRDLVLRDVAEKNIPDMERIERMTESYRNGLIVNQYLSTMSDHADDDISESRIKEYYEANHADMILVATFDKGCVYKGRRK